MQDGQYRAVTDRIEERRNLPGTRQWTGFGLTVADDTGDHQIRVVECGTRGVDQGIAEFAALVDAAGVCTLTWLGMPPGVENWRHRRRTPSLSSEMFG